MGYQWRFNGADLSGATLSNYSIGNAQPANEGNYSVVVTNQAGSVSRNRDAGGEGNCCLEGAELNAGWVGLNGPVPSLKNLFSAALHALREDSRELSRCG